jgi:hypothetical protein
MKKCQKKSIKLQDNPLFFAWYFQDYMTEYGSSFTVSRGCGEGYINHITYRINYSKLSTLKE